jgi:endonuclease/exonuclease/phosphatase family metal-dependent hydrolase
MTRRFVLLTLTSLIAYGCSPPDNQYASGAGPPPRSAKQFKLVTFNIHGAYSDLAKVGDFLLGCRADVICLQEVERAAPNSDQINTLAETTGLFHVASASTLGVPANQDCDVAILSRFPLSNPRAHALDPGGRIYAVSAELVSEDVRPVVYSVHLHATFQSNFKHLVESSTARTKQTMALLSMIRESRCEAIVAGDFNTPPVLAGYTDITREWSDLGKALGKGSETFPANKPFVRIDYVFAKGSYEARTYDTIPCSVSDHLPILATLCVKQLPHSAHLP